MKLAKRIFYSDRALHTAQGINIGLSIALVALGIAKIVKGKA